MILLSNVAGTYKKILIIFLPILLLFSNQHLLSKESKKDKSLSYDQFLELGEYQILEADKMPDGMFKGSASSNSLSMYKKSMKSFSIFSNKKNSSKYPHMLMEAMAYYEYFYNYKLGRNLTQKHIKKYREAYENKFQNISDKKKEKLEEKILSIVKINEGRIGMRSALGLSLDNTALESIKTFWTMAKFLEMGTPKENNVNSKLLRSKEKLDDLKSQYKNIKLNLEDNK
jgi:hypothetical protein